ncbi:hypothetical protein IHE45_16G029100 [Dioscorea alata]|uniref:Uncharacterized protein n=1 Tax=Dioscorea alata TaxID=55571 RepID=A0ACB7UGC4_DIOAL|nr:hypothetical protein IHE45_16G029100 [Dioscorea alata]
MSVLHSLSISSFPSISPHRASWILAFLSLDAAAQGPHGGGGTGAAAVLHWSGDHDCRRCASSRLYDVPQQAFLGPFVVFQADVGVKA